MLLSYLSDIALESRSSQPERSTPPVQRQAGSSRAAEFAICDETIELLFKHLKSVWHLDRLRARAPDAAQAHLLAVILAALLAGEVSSATAGPRDAWLDDPDRPLSRWRWEVLWHDAILQAIRGPVDLFTLQQRLPALQRLLCDSPRRRPHQATLARRFLRTHAPHQERRCAYVRAYGAWS
jgi:hypothetical protein